MLTTSGCEVRGERSHINHECAVCRVVRITFQDCDERTF